MEYQVLDTVKWRCIVHQQDRVINYCKIMLEPSTKSLSRKINFFARSDNDNDIKAVKHGIKRGV